MSLLSLCNWLKPLQRQALVCGRRHRRRDLTLRARILLRLEALEDRTVPSTLIVTSAADSGDGSLRAEIAAANSGDTIKFADTLAGQTIRLTSGELAITKSLTIKGLGADQLTVSGNNASRVFDISGRSTDVEISGLTIANGMANTTAATGPDGAVAMGGGILNTGANVTLSDATLENNRAVGVQNGYVQTNLVSDLASENAQITDPNLKNSWGIAESGDGPFWVSDQKTSVATVYTVTAAGISKVPLTVAIPKTASGPQGPTGQVNNDTSSFVVDGAPASFIFADLNGTISAWNKNAGTTAVVEATTPGAAYTGLVNDNIGSANYLYAANVKQGRIDVFNDSFQPVSLGANAFKAPTGTIPAGLVPFNIEDVNGDLYVMFAPAGPPTARNNAPLGSGAIVEFDTSGNFIKVLTSGGNLASPWGLTQAPSTFGKFGGDLLVGNFSYAAPAINAFNPTTGAYDGTVADSSGHTLLGNGQGIWDMSFGNGGNGGLPNTLYVATGLNAENDGLFVAIDPGPGIAEGGAVANISGGSLKVSHSTFTDNQARGVFGGDGLGGGIENDSGATLTIASSVFVHNLAVGSDSDGGKTGNGLGGAFANSGAKATVSDSRFTDNGAIGGDNAGGGVAGKGEGGGIANEAQAMLLVTETTLTDNLAKGGQRSKNSGDNGFGYGGGIGNRGTLAVDHSTFEHNQAFGGAGASSGISGGNGLGGGLMSVGKAGAPASASVLQSTFTDNQARGGTGGAHATGGGGSGGGIFIDTGTFLLSHSRLSDNQALGGAGGSGGRGRGGALAEGSQSGNTFVTVSNSTLRANQAVGGTANVGGTPGIGSGGGVSNQVNVPGHTADLIVRHSSLIGNEALGGAGDSGGTGRGGGIENVAGATLTVSDSILTRNRAVGGEGGDSGNGGDGLGGGIFNDATSSLALLGSAIVDNDAEGGEGGDSGSDGQGVGGGVYNLGTFSAVVSTIIKRNHASTSNDDVYP